MGRFAVSAAEAKAERRELVRRLERGFQLVQKSGAYRSYLRSVSRFHNYSISNSLLIWLQRPDATRVAGYRTWLSLGRQVRRGQKGMRILAPMYYRRNAVSAEDESGEVEEREIRNLQFRAVSVFDISQTEGADLAEPPVTLLSGDDSGLWQSLGTIAQREHLTIDRQPNRGGEGGPNGWYDRNGREIWVDPGLAPRMAAKTLCHELAHHFAEHIDSRTEHETIAESVAYIVLGHFGIDAADYSFGYLACWSDASTFKAKLTDIQTIAIRIVEGIERRDCLGGELGPCVPVPEHGGSESRVGAGPRPDFR